MSTIDHNPTYLGKVSRRSFLMTASALSGLAVMAKLGIVSAMAQDASRGGVLRFGIGDAVASEKLDPAIASNGSVTQLAPCVFETLLRRAPDYSLLPWLAEKWEANEDFTAWTFHLKPDIKFHDGSVMTADDVVYTFTRLMDESVGSSLRGRLLASMRPEGLKIIDAKTIKLELIKADTLLPEVFSRSPYAGIIKKGSKPALTPASAIGTGPFKVKSFVPGKSWELVRNDVYWVTGYPYLDGVQCALIPDQTAKAQAVISGAVDLTDGFDAAAAKKLADNPNVRLDLMKNFLFYGFFIDRTVKPFDDVRVRKALKLAMDRDQILKSAFQGYGDTTPDIPVPRSDAYFPPNAPAGTQDIQGAKALLAEAGYPNGIEFELFTSAVRPGMVDMAVLLAESAKAAGIKIKVNQWPTATYWDQVWGKKPAYIDFIGRRSVHDVLDVAFAKDGRFNGSKFDQDGTLRQEIEAALREPDAEKRKSKYQGALLRVANESSVPIPLFIHLISVINKSIGGDPQAFGEPFSIFALWKNK
ncbi:ABC transporter substrate-binding protein [Rhizobium leguminosarum]|uniref:ABC transporter substrate-binding protein n=1 Tax=Rhizobium leguminosarum TaxID=384 RepID=UPI0024A82511|nr:ABC transporter substrate-binding protein [Rhizobium leguminosarum]MDI5930013.1 ABC transporter substrate-binding protein [Rhizobium leguminosarum]